jgi:hypothetical protein
MTSLLTRTHPLRLLGPRTFSSSAPRAKGPVDVAKDVLKTVDRKVSDKLVDGIEMGGKLFHHLFYIP